jgi:hypothetical protein
MMDDTEVIVRFEDRSRYAREHGQHSLYVYLIVETILLAFTSYGSAYAIFLSLVGFLISVLWLLIGLRKKKIQGMLDIELEKHLLRLIPDETAQSKFPNYHVRKLINGHRVGIYELNCCEQLLGSGELIWILPLFFLAANLVAFSLVVWSFADLHQYNKTI